MNLPSGAQTRILHASQSITVVEVGGGIREYLAGTRAVLDGYGDTEMCAGGRGQLLLPWPNRLAGGRYTWAGRVYQVPLSQPDEGNAIHGLVRWSNWSVTGAGPGQAAARYRLHPQPGWAWTLDLKVRYRLSESGLEVSTTARNTSPEGAGPCPIAFGWHPYLHAFGGTLDDAVLTVPASLAYQSDNRGLPTHRYDLAGTDADFRVPRKVGPAVLDTAFTGLQRDASGRATVRMRSADGAAGTDLWIGAEYTHLMMFSGDTLADPEKRRRGLAVEPMTAAPDSFNNGDGLRTLDPGESLTASWGIDPQPGS